MATPYSNFVSANSSDWDDTPATPITPSEALSSSASLVIDNGAIRDTIAATPGELFYTTHQVSISATSVTGYSLTISTDKPSITANGTTLTGAGGKTATSMDNQWGYAWIPENADPSTASYNSLTTGGTDLAQASDVKNNSINYTKKLVFGAKFNDQAGNGHYTANVNLNLTVTPRQITSWNDLEYMQDITPELCKSAPANTPKTLKDVRDQQEYTVQKVGDSCWMTQNLRLAAGTKISDSDSDLNGIRSYALPSNTTGNFSNDNTAQQMRNSSDNNYGAYYSWCAATANTCQINDTPIAASTDATSSICPKGWKLPRGGTGTGTNDFAAAVDLSDINIAANYSYWGSVSNPSFANQSLIVNGVTWSAAGLVYGNGLIYVGSEGYYWSRTAFDASKAHVLYFKSGNLGLASSDVKLRGFSIRCVAEKAAAETTYSITYEWGNGFSQASTSYTLPKTETKTSSTGSASFTALSGFQAYNASSCSTAEVTKWQVKGGSTVYSAGDTIMLTANSPVLILIPTSIARGSSDAC